MEKKTKQLILCKREMATHENDTRMYVVYKTLPSELLSHYGLFVIASKKVDYGVYLCEVDKITKDKNDNPMMIVNPIRYIDVDVRCNRYIYEYLMHTSLYYKGYSQSTFAASFLLGTKGFFNLGELYIRYAPEVFFEHATYIFSEINNFIPEADEIIINKLISGEIMASYIEYALETPTHQDRLFKRIIENRFDISEYAQNHPWVHKVIEEFEKCPFMLHSDYIDRKCKEYIDKVNCQVINIEEHYLENTRRSLTVTDALDRLYEYCEKQKMLKKEERARKRKERKNN